jgi:hypothetical protein
VMDRWITEGASTEVPTPEATAPEPTI